MKIRSVLMLFSLGCALSAQPLALLASTDKGVLQSSFQGNLANSYGLPDFTTLVEENNRVVVNISTTQKRVRSIRNEGLSDEMLRFFFGLPQDKIDQLRDKMEKRFGESFSDKKGQNLPEEMPRKRQAHSLGSGFIISEDGYILTNYHVIKDADEILVKMRDRKEHVAELIGSDIKSDVALLKIKASGLPVAKIGSRKSLKVGQWVLAIGEPFGLDYTVTHGIISALGRALPDESYVPFIQTDVAINPGNSGGPLFNLAGEVIGINSQIYSKSGGAMGLSFSIPIDIAMNVVNQLKANGTFERGFLGVQIQDVTSELSDSFGLNKPTGALVSEAFKDTPADKAGIVSGDIILEFDGHKIDKSTDLPPVVGMTDINKEVTIKVLRQGKTHLVTVKLSVLGADKEKGLAEQKALASGGIQVEPLDKTDLKALNIRYGVKVVKVISKPGLNTELKQGDILVTLNFEPVTSQKALNALLKKQPRGKTLPVRVIRDGRSLFLPLVLEK